MRSKNTSGYFSFYVDNISLKTYSTSTRQGGVMIAFSQVLDFDLLCLIEIIKG